MQIQQDLPALREGWRGSELRKEEGYGPKPPSPVLAGTASAGLDCCGGRAAGEAAPPSKGRVAARPGPALPGGTWGPSNPSSSPGPGRDPGRWQPGCWSMAWRRGEGGVCGNGRRTVGFHFSWQDGALRGWQRSN